MQADLYNLYPAIGAVNAIRSNFNYQMLPDTAATFGTCPMKVANRRAEPPEYTRGPIARSTLYMAGAMLTFINSQSAASADGSLEQDVSADQWECTRAQRIQKIQKNENRFVTEACRKAGL